jgi:hypothetical protein
MGEKDGATATTRLIVAHRPRQLPRASVLWTLRPSRLSSERNYTVVILTR